MKLVRKLHKRKLIAETIWDFQGFENLKKNSFRGNYSRKYGNYNNSVIVRKAYLSSEEDSIGEVIGEGGLLTKGGILGGGGGAGGGGKGGVSGPDSEGGSGGKGGCCGGEGIPLSSGVSGEPEIRL